MDSQIPKMDSQNSRITRKILTLYFVAIVKHEWANFMDVTYFKTANAKYESTNEFRCFFFFSLKLVPSGLSNFFQHFKAYKYYILIRQQV